MSYLASPRKIHVLNLNSLLDFAIEFLNWFWLQFQPLCDAWWAAGDCSWPRRDPSGGLRLFPSLPERMQRWPGISTEPPGAPLLQPPHHRVHLQRGETSARLEISMTLTESFVTDRVLCNLPQSYCFFFNISKFILKDCERLEEYNKTASVMMFGICCVTIVVLILIIGNLIHKRLRRMRLITENENMDIIELDILNSNFLDKSKRSQASVL